jgi:uncharacterized protein
LKNCLPDPDLLRELVDYRMPFGKYSGRRLVDIPEPYLVWLQQKGMPSGKLGMLLETALVVRSNGLESLIWGLERGARS